MIRMHFQLTQMTLDFQADMEDFPKTIETSGCVLDFDEFCLEITTS